MRDLSASPALSFGKSFQLIRRPQRQRAEQGSVAEANSEWK